MELILFKVALHGANSKAARSLHCVCSTLTRQLQETDIWSYKFNHSYDASWSCPWWTSYENYKAQELGGVFEFLITPPTVKGAPSTL